MERGLEETLRRYEYGAPLYGKAVASSDITGRHRKKIEVAMRREIGELGLIRRVNLFRTRRHSLDTCYRRHSRQSIKHASEDIVPREPAAHQLPEDLASYYFLESCLPFLVVGGGERKRSASAPTRELELIREV